MGIEMTERDRAEKTLSKIKVQIETIDPARAAELLGTMVPNRNVRRFKVERYVRDMASGQWRLTGESIKLTGDGKVIDGEHRLRAVVKSGATIQSLVVYGVDIDDRVAMDTGAKRNLADHLKFMGEVNVAELSAAINVLYCRNRGFYLKYVEVSHQELIDELHDHPEIRSSLRVVKPVSRLLRIPVGICAALHYNMTELDRDDADDFWAKLYSAAGLGENDPVLVLRKRLEENAVIRGKRLDRDYIHAFVVKAWNAYREGREISILRWARGGSNRESFPELV